MSTIESNAGRVAARILSEAKSGRFITAVAGPPGAGKSTLAEAVAERLNADAGAEVAAVFPMDGYHFDDGILEARGQRARKGAPFTFDVDGYRATLMRLRAEPDAAIAVPVFDRSLEVSRGSARIIGAAHRFIITEGNYLLLDEDPWRTLAPLFDLTVMVRETEEELLRRLTARWQHYGLSEDAMKAKLADNDMPNVRFVLNTSRAADMTLSG